MNLLRTADGDIPGTGKVYDYNFNLGKILQSMTDSPEFDFISLVVSTDIIFKWMARCTDLHNTVRCRILPRSRVSRTLSHYMSRGVDRLLYYM